MKTNPLPIIGVILLLVVIAFILNELLKSKRSTNHYVYIGLSPYVYMQDSHFNERKVLTVSDIDHADGIAPETVMSADKPMSGFRQSINDLIKSNDIKSALYKVRDFARENAPHYHNETLQLSCRWEELSRNKRLGVLPNFEISQERSQLVSALLELAEKIAE